MAKKVRKLKKQRAKMNKELSRLDKETFKMAKTILKSENNSFYDAISFCKDYGFVKNIQDAITVEKDQLVFFDGLMTVDESFYADLIVGNSEPIRRVAKTLFDKLRLSSNLNLYSAYLLDIVQVMGTDFYNFGFQDGKIIIEDDKFEKQVSVLPLFIDGEYSQPARDHFVFLVTEPGSSTVPISSIAVGDECTSAYILSPLINHIDSIFARGE